jgi:hypothetical protein
MVRFLGLFSICVVSFPICAEVLSDAAYTAVDLDRPLKKALLSGVSVTFSDLASGKTRLFPFDPPLPMAVFLRPLVGQDSGAVLLEALGTTICRQMVGWGGSVSSFKSTLRSARGGAQSHWVRPMKA